MASSRTICASSMLLVLIVAFIACCEGHHVGGLNDEREADETVRNVVRSISGELSSQHKYVRVEPISYRRQVVSGLNYFVKARAFKEDGSQSLIHLRIYQPLRGLNELHAIKHNQQESHKLEYFTAEPTESSSA